MKPDGQGSVGLVTHFTTALWITGEASDKEHCAQWNLTKMKGDSSGSACCASTRGRRREQSNTCNAGESFRDAAQLFYSSATLWGARLHTLQGTRVSFPSAQPNLTETASKGYEEDKSFKKQQKMFEISLHLDQLENRVKRQHENQNKMQPSCHQPRTHMQSWWRPTRGTPGSTPCTGGAVFQSTDYSFLPPLEKSPPQSEKQLWNESAVRKRGNEVLPGPGLFAENANTHRRTTTKKANASEYVTNQSGFFKKQGGRSQCNH